VGTIGNSVVFEYAGRNEAVCVSCSISHKLAQGAELCIVKTAAGCTVRVGDVERCSLTVEDVGRGRLGAGVIIDTPPPGFSYVEGSMVVSDGDGAFVLSPGRHPLRIGGLDIAPGERATIVYLLRVGAGVRAGVQ